MTRAKKKCECGCGMPAPIAEKTVTKRGVKKGEPIRFVHGHHRRRPWQERFWDYVSEGDPGECWEWQGALDGRGYGQLVVENGRRVSAHRLSYQLHTGPIPDGLWVLHRCDNPRCVNPAHLFIGTRLDNIADMNRKGRGATKGERNPAAKLTEDAVREIRALFATGQFTHQELGERFGVSREHIGRVVRGELWAVAA